MPGNAPWSPSPRTPSGPRARGRRRYRRLRRTIRAQGDYREPLLASSSDGVGTKLAVAQAMGRHDTVGRDLVAMVVDDLVVCGAEPLFLQDYIAIGKVVPEIVAEIVKGIADGCVDAGCALLGGETAEHPGLMADGHYDISATGGALWRPTRCSRPTAFVLATS